MQISRPRRSFVTDLLRFSVSGGVTAVVDVGALVALTALGAPLAAATTVAFLAALCVNFAATRLLLGDNSVLAVHHQLGRYLVLLGVNYGVTLLLVLGASAMGLHYLVGKGLAIAVTAVVSFVAYRSWVFA